VALTLKIACGFSSRQIAQAFLANGTTVHQRILRAKQRLRGAGAQLGLPGPDALAARLAAVLDVVYLLFNEGYSPTDGAAAIKNELCLEALRLCRLLTEISPTATPRGICTASTRLLSGVAGGCAPGG
jgi:RNA polymerase sigma-70 factor, ECF subfamily